MSEKIFKPIIESYNVEEEHIYKICGGKAHYFSDWDESLPYRM